MAAASRRRQGHALETDSCIGVAILIYFSFAHRIYPGSYLCLLCPDRLEAMEIDWDGSHRETAGYLYL
jgi:hypothetical protein